MAEINVAREIELMAHSPYSYHALLLLIIAILIIIQPQWVDDTGRVFMMVLFTCVASLPERQV
jgi:hypothetical protein